MTSKRRERDFYPTPEFATRELLKEACISGTVLEPCVGDGAIAKILDVDLEGRSAGFVYTSDIAAGMNSFCGDATRKDFWD